MNLSAIANRATQRVTANIPITWMQSQGYTTSDSGSRTPNVVAVQCSGQVQGVTAQELQHIDGLNIEGVMRKVYLNGNAQGVVRADSKGGDTLQFPETSGGVARSWLVIAVLETWPDWCSVLVRLQS